MTESEWFYREVALERQKYEPTKMEKFFAGTAPGGDIDHQDPLRLYNIIYFA